MIFNRAFRAASEAVLEAPLEPEQLPEVLSGETAAGFDYVVIGAGAAGCALVDRILAGLPNASVLLLEAGPTNRVPQIRNFTEAMSLRGSIYDWNDKSQPQGCMDGQPMPYDSGHVNGGGSSINGMVWVRGHPGDFDNWAATGCAGWDYASVLPVFEREETYSGKEAGPTRGTRGPVRTTNVLSMNPVSADFVAATTGMGIPFNPDYNAGTQYGVTYTQLNVEQKPPPIYGIRWDAFNAFVEPHRITPNPNFVATTGTQVERIEFDGGGTARTVRFFYQGQSYAVSALEEVIVCAGTLRTPQILMLSGIGDPNQLAKFGIPVVHDAPAVGQNLQDQLIPFVIWNLKTVDPNHYSVMDNNVFVGDDGPLGSSTYELQTFYMKSNPGFPPNCFGVGAIVLHPESRGEVTLASANFADAPLIQPNLLCGGADIEVSLQGLKLAREVAKNFASKAKWLGSELAPGPSVITDQQLIAYIDKTAVPDFHYVGTCKMGPNAATSVVDPTCRVYGVNGLRVADASVMPFVTSGNTNAPSMMIGGRIGDFVVADASAP